MRINWEKTLFAFSILPMLSVYGFANLLGENVVQIWRYCSVIALLLLMVCQKKVKFDRFALYFLTYTVYIFLVSIANNGFDIGIMYSSMLSILLVLYIGNNLSVVINVIPPIGIAIIIINFLSVITTPVITEYSTMYFLGGKNSFSMFFVPILSLMILQQYIKYRKIKPTGFAFVAICFFCSVVTMSSTGILVMVFFIALLILNQFRILNVKWVAIVIVALNIIFIFIQSLLSNSRLISYVLELLGKDATLSSRIYIWNNALEIIKNNLIFGCGKGSYIGTFTECHNIILDILFEGGIVGGILFISYFRYSFENNKNDDFGNNLLLIGLLTMLFNGLAESVANKTLFIIVVAVLHYYKSKGLNKNGFKVYETET